MLVLREVLAFPAVEVAGMLGTSVAAVKSALRRARATMAAVTPDAVAEPTDRQARALLARYMAAWENSDPAAFERLLAVLTASPERLTAVTVFADPDLVERWS